MFSWAVLGLSWVGLGPSEAVLGLSWARLGPAVRLGTVLGLSWTILESIFGPKWNHFGLNFWVIFWTSFLTPFGRLLGTFGDSFWDQIGPRRAKMRPRGPPRASKYRKHAFVNTFKKQVFYNVFGEGRPRQPRKTPNNF